MAGESKQIRVLGLHGMGTSGQIFKTQTGACLPAHRPPAPALPPQFSIQERKKLKKEKLANPLLHPPSRLPQQALPHFQPHLRVSRRPLQRGPGPGHGRLLRLPPPDLVGVALGRPHPPRPRLPRQLPRAARALRHPHGLLARVRADW